MPGEEGNIFCQQCGNELSGDANFCNKCGMQVAEEVEGIETARGNVDLRYSPSNNYQLSFSTNKELPDGVARLVNQITNWLADLIKTIREDGLEGGKGKDNE